MPNIVHRSGYPQTVNIIGLLMKILSDQKEMFIQTVRDQDTFLIHINETLNKEQNHVGASTTVTVLPSSEMMVFILKSFSIASIRATSLGDLRFRLFSGMDI